MSLRKCIRCNYRGPSYEHCGWMTKLDGDQYTSDPIHVTSPAFFNPDSTPAPAPAPEPDPSPSFTPDPPSTDFTGGGGDFGGGGASGDF